MPTYVILLPLCILLICMDAIWFQFSGAIYAADVARVQGAPMQVRWHGGLVAWMLIGFGLWYFARDWRDGAVLGAVVYGVYNATNYALFKDYSAKVALMDTAWGTVACAIGGLVVSHMR